MKSWHDSYFTICCPRYQCVIRINIIDWVYVVALPWLTWSARPRVAPPRHDTAENWSAMFLTWQMGYHGGIYYDHQVPLWCRSGLLGFFGLVLYSIEDFRCAEGILGTILTDLGFSGVWYFSLRMSGLLKVYLVILDETNHCDVYWVRLCFIAPSTDWFLTLIGTVLITEKSVCYVDGG